MLELARQGVGGDTVALDPGGFWSDRELSVLGATLRPPQITHEEERNLTYRAGAFGLGRRGSLTPASSPLCPPGLIGTMSQPPWSHMYA